MKTVTKSAPNKKKAREWIKKENPSYSLDKLETIERAKPNQVRAWGEYKARLSSKTIKGEIDTFQRQPDIHWKLRGKQLTIRSQGQKETIPVVTKGSDYDYVLKKRKTQLNTSTMKAFVSTLNDSASINTQTQSILKSYLDLEGER